MPDTFTFEEATQAEPTTFSFEEASAPAATPAAPRFPHSDPNLVSTTKGGKQVEMAGLPVYDEAAAAATLAGNVSKATIGDIAAGFRASPEFSGNIPAALVGDELPMDTALTDAAKEAKFRGQLPVAATVGRIAEGVAATAPMIPMLGGLPAAAQKLAVAGFTAKMISDAPEIAKRLGNEMGKPADERDPDVLATATSDAIQTLGFSALGGVGLKREFSPRTTLEQGVNNARKVQEAAALHGDVRPQPIPSEGQVPTPQGSGGVQPSAAAPQAEVSLSPEHQSLLGQHWDNDAHEFATLGEGNVAVANHDTGKIQVDPVEFGKWMDNDLKGMTPEQKAAQVKSLFDHEDIHLKTAPEDADKFEASLSPIERAIFTRNYMKGNVGDLSPRNLGFEVIRKRVQQAMGMTPEEFVRTALKDRWTARALDALAETVGKIRRLKDSELNTHQKAILDEVMGNIKSATVAVSGNPEAKQQEYTEGPFSKREGDDKSPDLSSFIESFNRGDRTTTHDANRAGLKARSISDLEELLNAGIKAREKEYDLLRQARAEPDPDKKMAAIQKGLALNSQIPREAIETAVNAGGHVEGEGEYPTKLGDRPLDWRKNPDVADWMRANAGRIGMVLPDEIRGPAAKRESNKYDPDQDKFFKDITARGVPGAETIPPDQRPSAESLGVKISTPEQKIFANEVAFDQPSKSENKKNTPFRPITESESKSERELGEFLTEDARQGGSDLPVSHTKRLTALFDRQDGTVHLVSTYPVPRNKGYETFIGPRRTGKLEASLPKEPPVAYMVDPRIAGKERPNKPVGDLLSRYRPIYSILLREPKQNFHQQFNSMGEFFKNFGEEAKGMEREVGTGTTGIPQTPVRATPVRDTELSGMSQQPAENFVYPPEEEPNVPRPQKQELRSLHDFFGDEPPSDRTMFENKLVRGAANASRQMIAGLRKMANIERRQNRGVNMRQALEKVLDKLYENIKGSDTRSEFIEKTLAQSSPGTPKEIPSGRATRETGAREISTLRSRAPTAVEGQRGPAETPSEPPISVAKQEFLSPEEKADLEKRIKLESTPRQPAVSGGKLTLLGKQILHGEVPKERYSMGKTESIQTGVPTLDEIPKELQSEIFPTREVESEAPNEPEAIESLKQEKKVIAKGEGNKGQLDFWKKQGPAAKREMLDVKNKIEDYLDKTSASVSKAGSLDDQLFRLKTGGQADMDLALPVMKAGAKVIPHDDDVEVTKYADEIQVLGKSGIELTDAQQMMYETFGKPIQEQNAQIYRELVNAGVPVGESTYLGRIVQDPHSLYSRMARGVKRRAVEGSLIGQTASFFKRRVFKALEDEDGNRKLVALVGAGDKTKVISYDKNKPTFMGDMPHSSMRQPTLTTAQKHAQRIADLRRLVDMQRLNKEQAALDIQMNDVMQRPEGEGKAEAMKVVQDKIDAHQGKYVELEEQYPIPLFDTPREWTDKTGNKWHLTDATIGEIESNTNTRFYKSLVPALITQNLKLKQIYRAKNLLDEIKSSADFASVSRPAGGSAGRHVPPDWRQVSLRPFQGLLIEPRTADVLDLFHDEQRGPSDPMKLVNGITGFIKEAIFTINPFMHEPNLLNHYFTARGAEWVKPSGYKRLMESGTAAFNDVLNKSSFRDQALRAGAPLMNPMREMHAQVLNMLKKQLDTTPTLSRKIASRLGYANPLRMIRAFGDSLTWGTNEILTLQLIRETMSRTGLNLEDSIKEVGKHMPNYRVPARVLDSPITPAAVSKLASAVMRNPLITMWGHYHYGALRSYGEMAKEVFGNNSTKQQRIDGLGRIASIAFLMAAFYPVVDKVINSIMGTSGYKMRRAGSTTLPQNIADVARGKKSPQAALQSVLTPSPVPVGALELAFNRNMRNGLPVYDRHLGTDTLKSVGSFAANKISPVEEAGNVLGGKKSAKEFGLGLGGISQSRVDTAMSKFGRLADNWMKNNDDPSIREAYTRRATDVFPESDYQLLRSAVIRQDHSAGQMMVNRLLKTRTPDEVAQRIQAWKDSPFTGTKKTDDALMAQMTPAQWDLWYQAAQEREDIANGMMMNLAERLTESK